MIKKENNELTKALKYGKIKVIIEYDGNETELDIPDEIRYFFIGRMIAQNRNERW